MNILDHISESLGTNLWVKILKFFDADAALYPGSGSLFDPGSGSLFDPGSATLYFLYLLLLYYYYYCTSSILSAHISHGRGWVKYNCCA